MENGLNIGEIIERAKTVLNFKRDSQLAAYLGVSRSTLRNWVVRNSIDFPLLLGKLNGIDLNWLLMGKGIPYRKGSYKPGKDDKEKTDTQAGTAESQEERSIPLYNVSAADNLQKLLEDRKQYAVGKISIPDVPRCDGAVCINGDSMYPILKAGDIVGFKVISSPVNIIFGEMYLVSFGIGGDEYLTVKCINPSDKEGHLRLVSCNPQHEPMDIPLEAVHTVAIVKFSIRKNMMM